ncbi:hypothetical protein F5884DRAFT_761621 [Xylogone sp. PMI_703]|nr:hypothetical protein F5884DRAFT_761621 [Xylogone sp. PMI_703]
MGVLKFLFKSTLYGAAGSAGAFALWTRNSKFVEPSSTDPLLASPSYLKFNPSKNPVVHDVCVRRVPLDKIKPHLLEKEGRLVEAFCAGVWSGLGYAFQREYLSRKYQNSTTTAHQLWTRDQLRSSTYNVGTEITDHFQVLSKTPESIVVRCGDSPLKRDVRPSDGLFEMAAVVKRNEGVAEFRLTSVFYQGAGKASEKPMPPHIEFLHRLYTKLWMETAIWNVEM